MKQNTLIWLQRKYDWQAAEYIEQNTCMSDIMITDDAKQWVQVTWWLLITWSKIYMSVTWSSDSCDSLIYLLYVESFCFYANLN